MTVRSVTELLVVFSSPPPETVAVLVTLAGASPATFTVTVIGGQLPPAASASERWQVSVASVHVQPVPLRPVAGKPPGIVSVTVIVPLVGPAPTLLAVSV